MKRTNDEIEEPVRKSPWVLTGGILILILFLVLGVYLLVEALKTPDGPQDMLDMKRMALSGIGVILFSVAVLFFLIRLYKPSASTKKPAKRKPAKRKKSSKRK
jgi:membrane protein implicated in regulation of membrane protease activity